MTRRVLALVAMLAVVFVATLGTHTPAYADDSVIHRFDVKYDVQKDGTLRVVEDLTVDFRNNEHHGIFRDIPVRYPYDDTQDRQVVIFNLSVTNGSISVQTTRQVIGGTLRIRIGDPNRTVKGVQRYVITYTVDGGLNAFSDHDELYWNATGNSWEYPIEQATAIVTLPDVAPTQIACYEGPTKSTEPCSSSTAPNGASFVATDILPPGSGLPIVVGVPKGVVNIPPPALVPHAKSASEQLKDFVGVNVLVIAATILLGVLVIAGLVRLWWHTGRDRWLGDNYYLNQDRPDERIKPPFSHETVLPEYEPPKLTDNRRDDGSWDQLTPAEIGVLLDERADTLDVSATVIHLAVRGYLRIEDIGDKDYKLTKLKPSNPTLHPFESVLFDALFKDGDEVELKQLRDKGALYESLIESKDDLYDDVVVRKLFPKDPEATRTGWRIGGIATIAVAIAGGFLLGAFEIGALLAGPLVIVGLVLFLASRTMPRRTGLGREMLRRSLGFRLFLVTAEEDRERFNEDAGIFSKFLPYAIVFHCVEKWAKAFENAAEMPLGWYTSSTGQPFSPLIFPVFVSSFSTSMSASMASLGAVASGSSGSGWSSGFSGFSGGFGGGGFSGGGGGGGGGGGW